MLTGLRPPPNTDADGLMAAYQLAVDGIREDCVVSVAQSFVKGEIDVRGHDKAFAPSSAVFASECRSAEAARNAQERKQSKTIEHQEAKVQHSPEHRARMLAKFEDLKRAMAGDRAAQARLEKHGWKNEQI